MKSFINRHILSQSALDSGSITPMMAVMHRFAEIGNYNATVFRGDNIIRAFSLVVDKDAPKTLGKIDLGTFNRSSCILNPDVHTVFHAPHGSGGYSVVVEKLDGTTKSTVFDNRKLQDGDIFVAILIRPGRYSASDESGAKCEISVSRPVGRIIQHMPASKRGIIRPIVDNVSIECGKLGFRPEKVSIETAQSLLFMIRTARRIKIDYETETKGLKAEVESNIKDSA